MLKTALIGFPPEAQAAFSEALLSPSCPLRVTAAADPAPGRREAAAGLFPGSAVFADEEELYGAATGLEAALVLTPAEGRRGSLERALGRGLHAAAAPPFCFSSGQYDALAGAAARAGRALFCLQPWERSAAFSSLYGLLARGELGEVDYARVLLRAPGPDAAAGPGWPAFSALLGLVRRRPLAVCARQGSAFPHDGRAAAASLDALVSFGGATGSLRAETGRENLFRAEVSGALGEAVLEGARLTLHTAGGRREVETEEDLSQNLSRPRWLLEEFCAFEAETLDMSRRGNGLRNSRHCASLLRAAAYSARMDSAAVAV